MKVSEKEEKKSFFDLTDHGLLVKYNGWSIRTFIQCYGNFYFKWSFGYWSTQTTANVKDSENIFWDCVFSSVQPIFFKAKKQSRLEQISGRVCRKGITLVQKGWMLS